jgi:hypothetical protein
MVATLIYDRFKVNLSWPVKGFENWLIFYQARRNGVEIVHVFHGARDIESLLDGNPPKND